MVFRLLKSGFGKLKQALSKTSSMLSQKLKKLFGSPLDDETYDELERLLYEADVGAETAVFLAEKVKHYAKKHPEAKGDQLLERLKIEIDHLLPEKTTPLAEGSTKHPLVILVVGVNGNGKTTSVAKLARLYKESGKKVLLAAADTFRAAAIDQLAHWAEKVGVDIVKGHPKSDPAAVAFDALQAAVARGAEVVIIDTAGRLHTKIPLMQELEKIKRTCQKVIAGTPQETLLILDATMGQNTLDQAEKFNKFTPLTGLVLTKLDGTAKGGIAIALQKKLKIPVKFIGIGEGMDDLEPFDKKSYIDALLA